MQEKTPEQIKDIKEREAKALEMLRELQLTPACQVVATNMGDDAFGFKPIPFLQDTKFTPTTSPLQKENL